jgi:xylan 1,4-beta-xylosidase
MTLSLPITRILICTVLLPAAGQETVQIRVNADATQGPVRPVCSFFGYNEPNYTCMKDGRKLLTELADLTP